MGRNKKTTASDKTNLDKLTKDEKIASFDLYAQIFQYELDKILYSEARLETNEKDYSSAEQHFRDLGYEVFRSR